MISIEKTGENFRLVFDTKGRFAIHRITGEEAKYKLCKVKSNKVGPKGIPYINTHDGRTVRYPDPAIKVNDTIKLDIDTGKVNVSGDFLFSTTFLTVYNIYIYMFSKVWFYLSIFFDIYDMYSCVRC